MKDLLEFINSKTDNAYQFVKLVGVVYNDQTNKTSFRFIYKNSAKFTQEDKDKFYNLINEFYQNTLDIEVKVKRDYVDEEVVADMVYKYIFANNSSIKDEMDKNKIIVEMSNPINVNIGVSQPVYDYFMSTNSKDAIKKHLEDNTFELFEIDFNVSQDDLAYKKALDEKHEILSMSLDNFDIKPAQKVHLDDLIKVFGADLENEAVNISNIKSAVQNLQIAGNVKYFMPRTFTSKRADKNGNYPQKTYYSFTLVYGSSQIACVYFPVKADAENEFALAENMQVTVGGDVEEYQGRLNFKVKSLSACKFEEPKEMEIKQKKVNDNYLFVKPQKVENQEQFNFFDAPKKVNDFLMQNDVVVFDVETTGLDWKTNEVIEIGAVKLHEGEITESFSCFVRPKSKIPAEITRLTGITDAMVSSAFSISEVIVDFYKFCYGCVIVAYNIDFDYKFINSAGMAVGYKFTNRQVDAMYLARKEVKGAKNFTLSSICKRLGVSLEGAHRAINDATATAEVVKLISDNVSPN